MVKFNPMDYGYIVRWQSDLVNAKESLFPVCEKNLLHEQWKTTERGGDCCFAELYSSFKQYTPHTRFWEWYIRMNVSDASHGGRHKSVIMSDHLFE